MRPEDPDRHLPGEDDDLDPRWLDVADRISSGEAVDWASLEKEVNDEHARRLLRSLGTLASIGELHTGTHQIESPGSRQVESSEAGEPAQLPVSGETWGSLELIERLGHGSYGSVWSARDPKLDREVALKLLHPGRALEPDQRERILAEGRCLARLDHPNVVRIHGVEEHADQIGLWMERVRGRTLANLVQANGPFGAEEATLIGEKLARALAAVHAQGVVHRDVKAQNVMRAEGGRVVLMDFGAFGEIEPDPQPDGPRLVQGTPLYLAPELLQGAAASARSDIYSLGVLLHHLVTGAYPVEARDTVELQKAHARGRRRSLADARPDLPSSFVTVVERALAPDPDARFATAGEMAQALAGLGASSSTETVVAAPSPAKSTARSLRGWLALAAVVAVIAVGWWVRSPSPAFTVDAAMLRYQEQSVEELFSGATLAVDQDLGLRLSPSHDVHVYVLNRDAQGENWVLFPLRGGDLQNPLPGGVTHELPGTLEGEEIAWTVTSAGGREEILVVASAEPLPELERRIAAAPQAGDTSPYTPVETELLEGLRGIGGVSTRARPDTATGVAGDLLGSVEDLVEGRGEARDGVWMRRIVLRNPGS